LEIDIGGQSHIGNWPNIGEKVLKISISVSKKKNIGRSLVRTQFAVVFADISQADKSL